MPLASTALAAGCSVEPSPVTDTTIAELSASGCVNGTKYKFSGRAEKIETETQTDFFTYVDPVSGKPKTGNALDKITTYKIKDDISSMIVKEEEEAARVSLPIVAATATDRSGDVIVIGEAELIGDTCIIVAEEIKSQD